MKKEKTIKAHTRKTKSGKTVNVRQHKASYEAAEDIVKDALKKKKGSGKELEARRMFYESSPENLTYDELGFTKEEFREWYEGTGSESDAKVERILRKALGSKAYTKLSDSAADNYKKGGYNRFFAKDVYDSLRTNLVEHYDQFNHRSFGRPVGKPFKLTEDTGKWGKVTYDAQFVSDAEGRIGFVIRDPEEEGDTFDVGIEEAPSHAKLPKGLRKAAEERGLHYNGDGTFSKVSSKKKSKKSEDELPDISYNPKYDNDEPAKRKPRKTPRTKDVKDVLDESEKKGQRAISKYRKARDSKKTPKGTPFTFRGKTYYVSGNSVVTAAGNVPTDTTVGNVLYAFKRQKSKNPRAGAYKDAHGGISMD